MLNARWNCFGLWWTKKHNIVKFSSVSWRPFPTTGSCFPMACIQYHAWAPSTFLKERGLRFLLQVKELISLRQSWLCNNIRSVEFGDKDRKVEKDLRFTGVLYPPRWLRLHSIVEGLDVFWGVQACWIVVLSSDHFGCSAWSCGSSEWHSTPVVRTSYVPYFLHARGQRQNQECLTCRWGVQSSLTNVQPQEAKELLPNCHPNVTNRAELSGDGEDHRSEHHPYPFTSDPRSIFWHQSQCLAEVKGWGQTCQTNTWSCLRYLSCIWSQSID